MQKDTAAQVAYDSLKKDYLVLMDYERNSRAKKEAYGYEREELDKKLLVLAKEILSDKKLLNILSRDVPQVVDSIVKRVKLAQKCGIGVKK